MTQPEQRKGMHKMPPFYFFVALVAMVVLHYLPPHLEIIPAPANVFGLALVLIGFGVILWGARIFSVADTTIRPYEEATTLVVHGPYKYSRHPMYLGMVVILLGIAILLGSLLPLIIIPAFIWIVTVNFIHEEERMMEQTFGEQYQQYRQRVRRWL